MSTNERGRNHLAQGPNASQPAQLPGIPALPLSVDPSIRRFLEAVKEHLEVRAGARGNPYEQVVTKRDLLAAGLSVNASLSGQRGGGVGSSLMMQRPDGSYAAMTVDEFAAELFNSKLYKDLITRLDDPSRFDNFPQEVRDALANSIAAEAAARGADIRSTETKLQTDMRSLAMKVDEVTAAIEQSSAGVRELTFASAEANRAQAGKVTQIEARINGIAIAADQINATVYANLAALTTAVPKPDRVTYYQVDDPGSTDNLLYRWNGINWVLSGRGTTASGTATVEQSMVTTADRVDGLSGEYMLKVQAGNKLAGIGLAASEDPQGNSQSAFIVLADKFAVVTGTDSIPDPKNPPLNRVPFGVDANGVYINGQLRVNAGGGTLDELATTAGTPGLTGQSITATATSQVFAINNSNTATPGSIICSVIRPSALQNAVTKNADFVWTLVSGSCTQDLTTINSSTGAFGSLSPSEITSDAATFRCTYTVADPGHPYNGMAFSDDITITKVKQGVGVSTFLTNESHNVPADKDGVVTDWVGAGGTFKVYSGTTDVTGSCSFSIATNTSNLTANIGANTGVFSVTGAGSWASSSNTTTLTLRAAYVHPVTGSASYDKVFTLSKSKAGVNGANGANGANGTDGTRGSLTLYASGTAWSDATANSKILGVTGSSTKVIGDTVTISNGTSFAATKYWSGTAWVSPGVVIDGNLLVSGTVSAASLATNQAVITDTLQIGADLITVPKRASDVVAVTLTSTMGSLLRLQVNYGNAATSGVHVSATVQLNAPAGATMADTELQLGVSLDGEATWGYGDLWKCKHNNTMPITFTWSQPNNFTGTVVFRIYGRRTAGTGWTVTNRIMNVMATKR